MELSFITTPEQAWRLATADRSAISFGMKREAFDALGLGLGLGDQREAVINEKTWRLIGVDIDPTTPAVVETTWLPATPDMGSGGD